MHYNIIMQYEPTKFTFSKPIFSFIQFDGLYCIITLECMAQKT